MKPAPKQSTLNLTLDIEPGQQGSYFLLPFEMPPNVERLDLRYQYARFQENVCRDGNAVFTSRLEANIIDLGLIAPDGSQAGASGSDKTEITLSAVDATPGYQAMSLAPGAWQILVGAYKVAPSGVRVRYELTFTFKEPRWLKGDLHVHTLASDGVLTPAELAWQAKRHGLDFLAITDHNQPVGKEVLPLIPGVTLIPGVEWTHYRGHANFLGVDRPYDGSFMANSEEEARAKFVSARQRGALVVLGHPFEPGMGFELNMESLPFDCLEVWSGPMREPNLHALGLWQSWLVAGKKIPAVGGSDYHRDTPFIFLGGPTTCVYALSTSPADILSALRAGHAYITYAPDGPWLDLRAGEALPGDTVLFADNQEIWLRAGGLLAGDRVQVVTGAGTELVIQAPSSGQVEATYRMQAPGFARLEIWRSFLPGIPQLPALVSNPIYFDP